MTEIELIDEKIKGAFVARQHLQALGENASTLRMEQGKLQEIQSQAAEKLAQEKEELAKLESMGFGRLFAKLKGNLEEKIHTQQQQVSLAHGEFDRATRNLTHVNDTLADLRSQEEEARKKANGLKKLMAEKQSLLIAQGAAVGVKLAEGETLLNQAYAMLKEVEQAKAAGWRAKDTIMQMEQQLESAESLGMWDMLGGGVLVTMAKHGRMDEAQDLSQQLAQDLMEFQKQMADVPLGISAPDVSISSLARAGDYLVDSVFMDYHIQKKISHAKADTYQTKFKIDMALTQLDGLTKNLMADIQTIVTKQTELLMP